MNTQELKQKINQIIATREYDKILPLLLEHKSMTEQDNELATICYLCIIYEQEKKAGCEVIFSKISCMEELLERYTRLKFYLRRIDFGVIGEQMDIFYEFLTLNQVSPYELLRVIDFSVVNKEKVIGIIKGEAEREDNINRSRTESMVSSPLHARLYFFSPHITCICIMNSPAVCGTLLQ